MKLMHVDASPKGEQSNSRYLSQQFVQALAQADPQLEIDYLDLADNPLPHIDGEFARAIYKAESERSESMQAHLQVSDKLCSRILTADCAVFAVPMHNWCYPSVFKAFIDHITRMGVTFHFDENGNLTGRLAGKKMLFITTRGADLSGTSEMAHMDALTPAIRSAFGFLGVDNMQFIDAQPLQFADQQAHQQALEKARQEVLDLAENWLPV